MTKASICWLLSYYSKCEEFEGKAFRVYSKSKFLDYVKATTYVTTDYPGPYNHYGFICLDHIINVVSSDAPIVMEYNCK